MRMVPSSGLRRLLPAALCAALAAACSPFGAYEETARVADPTSLRRPPAGDVIGFQGAYGSHVWLGIPYAQAPVGELRWRAPEPAERWTDRREALALGPPCVQLASPLGGVVDAEPGDVVGSEDCLSLNVYAPRHGSDDVPSGDARHPVMLWIHGGGHTIGTSGFYDGGNLAARHELVVVTINYRLGPFGWFRHTALSGNDARDRSGNYGTLDLIRSLEWVRDNISAFGGDPGNVTVFGESAGGSNVLSLLLSPLAEGLFHRAILQSPGFWTSPADEAEGNRDGGGPQWGIAASEAVLRLLEADGTASNRETARTRAAEMGAAQLASYLRSKTPEEILGVYARESESGMYGLPTLIRDGSVIPVDEPMERLASRDGYNRVPVILGTNRDEDKLFMYFDPEYVRSAFGIPLWVRDPGRYELVAEYSAKMWKATAVDEPAALLRRVQGASVYAYRWDWDEEPRVLWSDLSALVGAGHGLEIPFVFGHWDLGPGGKILFDEANAPARRALSDAMMSYWAQFAYTGDPARGRDAELPLWSAWDDSSPDAGKFVVLDTERDGGIRMSASSLTRARVAAQLGGDPRLRQRVARCGLMEQVARWGELGSAAVAMAGCAPRAVAAPPPGE